MTPCNGIKTISLTLPRKPDEPFETTLQENEEEFFTFATHQTLHLQSHQHIETQQHRSTETLTLQTQCYAVDFNDDFVTMTLLK